MEKTLDGILGCMVLVQNKKSLTIHFTQNAQIGRKLTLVYIEKVLIITILSLNSLPVGLI
jgi:hypothetical protein